MELTRQNAMWPILLSCDTQEWCGQDIWNEEDRQDDIVSVVTEAKILLKASSLCITKIAFIQTVEQVLQSISICS